MQFTSDTIFDYIIVGAGIVGLSVANALRNRYPEATIAILEKEATIGLHASGRNSGVLHSGIYYKEGSIKAKLCLQGALAMKAYCEEHNLPIHYTGKLILPLTEIDSENLNILYQRAKVNGATVDLIDNQSLKEIEPKARSGTGYNK